MLAVFIYNLRSNKALSAGKFFVPILIPEMSFEPGRDYDVIFAGGGTAACVAAGRLAASDSSLSILIIERGKNNLNEPTIRTPALLGANMLPTSQFNLFYHTEKEPQLKDRSQAIAAGGVLGGGSSINALMYTRAQRRDFDSFGVEGWDGETLIEFAKKVTDSVPCLTPGITTLIEYPVARNSFRK